MFLLTRGVNEILRALGPSNGSFPPMEMDSDSDPWDGDLSQNGYSSHQGKSPYWNPNPNLYQWKNFCIVQCSYQGNPLYRESSPYPSPLVEISHYNEFGYKEQVATTSK